MKVIDMADSFMCLMNEYQAQNLLWLLEECEEKHPELNSGDWFHEIKNSLDALKMQSDLRCRR